MISLEQGELINVIWMYTLRYEIELNENRIKMHLIFKMVWSNILNKDKVLKC